jgi:chemotaxis protein CheC
MSASTQRPAELVVDRLRELANIGAGHAAGALAQLLGRPIRMEVPRVRIERAQARAPSPDPRAFSGPATVVWFEVHGGPGGLLAVVLPEREMDTLLEAVLGAPELERADQAESALQEVGNILASHALSAVADTLGALVLPSIPRLETGPAAARVSPLAAEPAGAERLRIETDLVDADGDLHGVLVWIPA